MRGLFTLFLVLACIAFVWGGAQETFVGLTNTSPTSVTCAELLNDSPSAKWLELNDCVINAEDVVAVRYEKFNVVNGYYAPLIPADSPGARAPIVVKAKTEEALLKLVLREKIMGLVQFGIESDTETREALDEGNLRLAENYLILEPDTAPNLGMSATLLVIGLLIGAYLFRKFAKGSDDAAKPRPPVHHVVGPGETSDGTFNVNIPERDDALQPASR